MNVLLSTTEFVPGYETTVIGVVYGNTVRSKHIGKDIMSGLKSIVGGELEAYTEMLSESRLEAINRMVNTAKGMGADAVVAIRFTTSETMPGAAEMLAYGTAVKLTPKK
ncbi:hypothetical protein ABH15_10590 [Methanoculleus taiwanensis]|uniref:UPF0145 protein ABH15_10590 n=1 Tax=Methanoculleus taiwanensis TaxID=1550565 RepID=A0A498GX25_9EURY|nr:YbjQ family protein [Methanoculleus taiwanensis]RXE55232.1 hypothetical protein ABH15_10590 [Methanoculleus taiwanensis]